MKYTFSQMQEIRKKIDPNQKYTIREIAEMMGLSIRTVRKHIAKMGIQPVDVYQWAYMYLGHDVRKIFRMYREDVPIRRIQEMRVQKETKRDALMEKLSK